MQSTKNWTSIAIGTHYNVLDCHHTITDSAMIDQIIEKVAGDVNEDSETAEPPSASEDLFQRRYKEGYDIYDEP